MILRSGERLSEVDRGDVYHVDLEPISGREQAGARYVLVVTRKSFNELGTPLICPITQGGGFARQAGFTVSLTGTGLQTQGVVLCYQARAVDLQSRGARRVETAPDFIIEEVLAKLSTLLD